MFNFIPTYNPFNTFQFTNNQWLMMIESVRSGSTTSPSSVTTVLDNLDDHCDRHLDTIIANLNNRFDEEENNYETSKLNDDEDELDQNENDQVTIFQESEENVENEREFNSINKTVNKTTIKQKDSKLNKKMNDTETNDTKDVLPVSSMPTPMIYISRNSSMTSLNSFDIKSVHSSVASEYSQVTSPANTNNKKTKDDEDANYSVDEDLDLIMPESPSAQHESSFLMTQRIKHKQQQIIYRQTAAAAMKPSTTTSNPSNDTSILPNNLFPNDPKLINYMQQMGKCFTNSNFKTVLDSGALVPINNTSNDLSNPNWFSQAPIVDHTNSKLSELNQNMTRLNLNSNESGTLSFLNSTSTSIKTSTTISSSNIHTPPVKLVQTPKFLNFQQPVLAQFNPVVPPTNTALMPVSQAPMSVSYAFMKQSNTIPLPPSTVSTTTKQNIPKFLQLNSVGLQTFNPMLPPALSTSSSSTSSSSSSQASVINQPPQQLSPTLSVVSNQESEAPHVYTTESRVNYNQIRSGTTSGQLSPQESVCSRISELSMASSIKPKRDFKALLSKLNSNNKKDLNDQTLSYDEERPKVFQTCDDHSDNNTSSSFNNTITQFSANAASVPPPPTTSQFKPQFLFNRQFPIVTTTAISPFNASLQPNYLLNQSASINLDQTYSPKVFQNEGTNSRYSSASSLNNDEDDEDEEVDTKQTMFKNIKFNNLKQMNTPVLCAQETPTSSLAKQDESTNDQEDDILENFINEMLPVVDDNVASSTISTTNSKKSMHNSESSLSLTSSVTSSVSRQNLKQLNSNKIQVKNQLSKSSSFKENKQITLNTTNPLAKSTTSSFTKKPINKRLSAENTTTLIVQKPKTVLAKNVSNTITNSLAKSNASTKSESVKSISSTGSISTPPVVNMTKTAQLRANNNKKTVAPTIPSKQSISKSTTTTNSVLKQMMKTKENTLNKLSNLESNDLNNSTHFGEHNTTTTAHSTTTRRQSFSFGCNNTKLNNSSHVKSTAIKTDTNNRLQTTKAKLNK